jgi:hypothetical protein
MLYSTVLYDTVQYCTVSYLQYSTVAWTRPCSHCARHPDHSGTMGTFQPGFPSNPAALPLPRTPSARSFANTASGLGLRLGQASCERRRVAAAAAAATTCSIGGPSLLLGGDPEPHGLVLQKVPSPSSSSCPAHIEDELEESSSGGEPLPRRDPNEPGEPSCGAPLRSGRFCCCLCCCCCACTAAASQAATAADAAAAAAARPPAAAAAAMAADCAAAS